MMYAVRVLVPSRLAKWTSHVSTYSSKAFLIAVVIAPHSAIS